MASAIESGQLTDAIKTRSAIPKILHVNIQAWWIRWLTQRRHSHNIPIVIRNVPDLDEEPHNNTYEMCGQIRIISKTTGIKKHN
jgi:hypothetical protein